MGFSTVGCLADMMRADGVSHDLSYMRYALR
jgi:hypothetical protein